MNVCFTALIGDYEELKRPKIISEGWMYICFTDQQITSDVWQIKQVELSGLSPQLMARYIKIMEFVDWENSIWVDASFQIDTDLNGFWNKYFKGGLCAAKHPIRNDVYSECLDCISSQRGDREQISAQMREYKALGIPANGGLIQSGILLRENTPEVIELCENWYSELSTRSIRDQIAFAKVSLNSPIVHTYTWDYRSRVDFLYFFHFNRRGGKNVPLKYFYEEK